MTIVPNWTLERLGYVPTLERGTINFHRYSHKDGTFLVLTDFVLGGFNDRSHAPAWERRQGRSSVPC